MPTRTLGIRSDGDGSLLNLPPLQASLLGEQEQAAATRPAAQLVTLRMTKDELGFRVVCVAGALEQPTAADVMGAPKVSSGGIFGNFHVPGGDHEWVVSGEEAKVCWGP